MRQAAAHGRRLSLVFAACWAIPGAGFCALAFCGGFAPSQPFAPDPAWLTGPAGALLAVLGVACAFLWLILPVSLLVVGIGQLRATTPRRLRWSAIWAGAVVAGIALDPLVLWAIKTSYASDGFQWTWLTATVGFLAVGVAMTAILISAPRSSANTSSAVRLPVP
jgi:hypothetical protein